MLWKNVRKGLSAGRVQSVATKLIIDREEEIKNFKPEEYWTLSLKIKTKNNENFEIKFQNDNLGNKEIHTEAEVDRILNHIQNHEAIVTSVKKGEKKETLIYRLQPVLYSRKLLIN